MATVGQPVGKQRVCEGGLLAAWRAGLALSHGAGEDAETLLEWPRWSGEGKEGCLAMASVPSVCASSVR